MTEGFPEQPPEEGSSFWSEFSPRSIIRTVWKRRMCIGLVWLVLAICSGAVVHKLPAVYTSEAVIVVDSQKIPEKFVSATVASDLQDRIETIKQQILTSGKLKKIIYDYSLYRDKRKTHFEEEILELMRRDISITLIESVRAGGLGRPGAFRIGYTGSEPTLVAQVANRLANLYVQENLTTREVQAQGTSEFLETQLQEAKRRLDQLEASVSSYKLKHIDELPQQQDALVGALAQLRIQLEANRDAINRAQQTKIILENSLSAAEMNLAGYLRASEPVSDESAPNPVAGTATPATPRKSEDIANRVGYPSRTLSRRSSGRDTAPCCPRVRPTVRGAGTGA